MNPYRPDGPTRRAMLAAVAALCAAVWPAASARAQVGADGRRIYAEQLRVQLDQQAAAARETGLDGGGWLNFAYYHYDDAAARRDRRLRQYELRLWGSANYRGVHRAYVRGLMGYNDWNSGQNPIEMHGDQYTGLEIERAWYQFDLGRMLANRTGRQPAVALRVRVGRQFAEIGTGLVLSMPLDMISFEASVPNWRMDALLGKTIYSTRNIDDSAVVWNHQRRCFWGFQLTYTGLSRHRPFVYYLDNQDHTRPDPYDAFQGYDYSTRYVGVGSRGSIFLPNLRYRGEVVGEFGKTFSDGVTAGRDRLCAMATDFLLEYLFEGPTHPRVSFEHIWASGDQDRSTSATATVGGNRAGTRDHAFNAFGYRDTGLAYAPRLSNIHMYALGASFLPLESLELFRKMEVGSKVFFYHRAAGDGAVSDTTVDTGSRWLGWEWDVYCNWRVTSDLALTIRYGAFMPGAAYRSNDSCRQFLMTAVTFSF
ncbi:MAG: alginate export family protein [Planctomycetes bacterium]|nr:alginate export family protein [Planctomycetota bacterium]